MFKHIFGTICESSILLFIVWKFEYMYSNIILSLSPNRFTEINEYLLLCKNGLGLIVTIIILITASFKMVSVIKKDKK